MTKKLKRTRHDNVLAGVCGGIAKYFNIDVTLVRGIWVISSILGGPGLGIYILCAIIIPKESSYDSIKEEKYDYDEPEQGFDDERRYEENQYDDEYASYRNESEDDLYENEKSYKENEDGDRQNKNYLGIGLIALGGYMTFKIIFPSVAFNFLWPVLLIGGGLMLLNNRKDNEGDNDE